MECGTHAICDAGFWPYDVSERVGARRLLRSVGPGMLVLWDRGLHSYELCHRCQQRGAEFLSRVKGSLTFPHRTPLGDGSSLADLRPPHRLKRQGCRPRVVRVIEYTIDDPARPGPGQFHRVITSLLDPVAYPAHALACLYHERWEAEVTVDEVDTHQPRPQAVLRSQTPCGVLQELYGLVLAHYAIRAVMHAAAVQTGVAPDRLSFVHTLRIIREAVVEAQILAPEQRGAWQARLWRDIARGRLPARDQRCNQRVVRHKMSKFNFKRPVHRHPPQPTKPFAQALVLLI